MPTDTVAILHKPYLRYDYPSILLAIGITLALLFIVSFTITFFDNEYDPYRFNGNTHSWKNKKSYHIFIKCVQASITVLLLVVTIVTMRLATNAIDNYNAWENQTPSSVAKYFGLKPAGHNSDKNLLFDPKTNAYKECSIKELSHTDSTKHIQLYCANGQPQPVK